MRGKKKPLDLGWSGLGEWNEGRKLLKPAFSFFQQQFLSRVGSLPVGRDFY